MDLSKINSLVIMAVKLIADDSGNYLRYDQNRRRLRFKMEAQEFVQMLDKSSQTLYS